MLRGDSSLRENCTPASAPEGFGRSRKEATTMVSKLLGLVLKPERAEDPVCHMQVDVKKPPGGTHEHQGTTYYFCGVGCRNVFAENPAKYLGPNFEGEPM